MDFTFLVQYGVKLLKMLFTVAQALSMVLRKLFRSKQPIIGENLKKGGKNRHISNISVFC